MFSEHITTPPNQLRADGPPHRSQRTNALVSINDVFAVARENNFGAALSIYKNPARYEWGVIFENGEVFGRLDVDPKNYDRLRIRLHPI
jgi:hypothetical protein